MITIDGITNIAVVLAAAVFGIGLRHALSIYARYKSECRDLRLSKAIIAEMSPDEAIRILTRLKGV